MSGASGATAAAPGPIEIVLEGVQKRFGGTPVLRGVDLTIRGGEVLGLVGENGAGKSSLMNILAGTIRADHGTMRIDGGPFAPADPADALRAGIALVHQELALFPNLTIAENLHLVRFPRRGPLPWIDRGASHRAAATVLARVGLARPPATLVERLSPGERQLVEIARALAARARLLILDEPTTSLGVAERDRLHALVRELRGDGLAVVYVSHELGDVLRESDRVAVLRDGTVVAAGTPAEFTADALVRHMVGREVRQLYPDKGPGGGPDPVLRVDGLCAARVRDIRLAVHRGELLGVFGLMGAGRTQLARVLFGLEPQHAGQVLLDGRPLTGGPAARIARGLALVPEDRRTDGLCLEAPVADNLALASLRDLARGPFGLVDRTALAGAVRRIAGEVHLTGVADLGAPVRRLSGGNQQKVVLGKWLLARPRLLMLDEPTRGVDVAARAEIYRILQRIAAGGAGLLVISSDLEELMGICHRIVVMRHGTISGSFQADACVREDLLRAALPASVA